MNRYNFLEQVNAPKRVNGKVIDKRLPAPSNTVQENTEEDSLYDDIDDIKDGEYEEEDE